MAVPPPPPQPGPDPCDPAAAAVPAGLEGVIERFDHVAVATVDLRAIMPLVELLQGVFRTGGTSRRRFHWVQFHLPAAGKLELLQPASDAGADHFLVRFLRTHGGGVHHLTFKVTDVGAAIDSAKALGYDVFGVDTSRERWKEAFIHPRDAHGVLIQLAQWRDGPPAAEVTLESVLAAAAT